MGFLDRLRGKAETGAEPPTEPPAAAGDDGDASAPGWDAIAAAGRRAHPDQPTPFHVGTIIKHRFGGPDPLDGIDVHRSASPVPHWHYVSYGFSDLYDDTPQADADAVSGFGFEMTFRLADAAAADAHVDPPLWPASLLQHLARYVFDSGNVFSPGHHIDLNGPICVDEPTALTALVFVEDPDMGSITTPRGRVDFIQAVGVTTAELDVIGRWNALAVAEMLDERHPRGVTDLTRASLTDDPGVMARIEDGIRRDGSSQGMLYVDHLGVERNATPPVVEIGAGIVDRLISVLMGRIPFDRPLMMVGREAALIFSPGAPAGMEPAEDGAPAITLSPADVESLAATLRPERGEYRAPGLDVVWRVVPSNITDDDGNVVETIG